MSGQIWSLRWTQVWHMNLDRTTGNFQLCVVSGCVLYPWWNCSAPNYSVLNSLCFPSQYNHILQLLALDKETFVRGMCLDRSKQTRLWGCLFCSMRRTNVKLCLDAYISLRFHTLASAFDHMKGRNFVTETETISSPFQPNQISLLCFCGLRWMWLTAPGHEVNKTESQNHLKLERAHHPFANIWLVFLLFSRNVQNANYTAEL